MNLVGKIFTVLILVMSVVFASCMVAVYATHKNWMVVVDNATATPTAPLGLSQQLTAARTENKDLEKKKQDLESTIQIEKTRFDKRAAQLETENQALRKEKLANEGQIQDLEKQVREAVMAMKATHETLAVLRQQVDTLRVDLKTAQTVRDDTFKKVVDLTDQVNSLANERVRLNKLSKDLVDQLTKARECLHYFKLNEGADYKAKEPPTGLQGEITGVPRADLVEVSIGADDGLRKGHKLEVVRVGGGVVSYVGRVEVMEASPDRAVCRPDPAMLRSPIQKGDRVYANLSQVR